MEIPHLVTERLGEESVEATVNLGDDDLVCLTPSRTLVYRSEGLLSDESVSVFSHDVERLDVSESRRKTKFRFEYVDGTESFTVPGDRSEPVLKLLLGGILSVAEVIEAGESIAGVFTFSELTLIVTSDRLVKHVGEPVWDDDYEVYPYADVTGLSFEEGSVATQVVLSVDGRPERIKAPSDEAKQVERALTGTLFAYHDVDTLAELNEKVGPDSEQESDESASPGGIALDDDISPLVSDDETDESGPSGGDAATAGSDPVGRTASTAETGSRDPGGTAEDDRAGAGAAGDAAAAGSDSAGGSRSSASGRSGAGQRSESDLTDRSGGGGRASQGDRADSAGRDDGDRPAVDPEDVEAIEDQLSTLTTAVKQQNKLLRDQQETIQQLIEELRRGR